MLPVEREGGMRRDMDFLVGMFAGALLACCAFTGTILAWALWIIGRIG
jgi:hypothetical protein